MVLDRLDELKSKFSEAIDLKAKYTSNKTRVLAEKDDKQIIGDDIDPDLINAFNEKYDSNLLLPVDYDFASDFNIQEKK